MTQYTHLDLYEYVNIFTKEKKVIFFQKKFFLTEKRSYICTRNGEMAEWSNAAVLKTVEGHTSGGSNPSFSARSTKPQFLLRFCFFYLLFIFIPILKKEPQVYSYSTQKYISSIYPF